MHIMFAYIDGTLFVRKIIQQADFAVNQILITSYTKSEQYIGGLIVYKCQGTNTLSTWFKFSVISIVVSPYNSIINSKEIHGSLASLYNLYR